MKRVKTFIIVFGIVLTAVVAGFFDFPERINPRLAQLPGNVQVPVIPFKLGLDLQGGIHLVYEADLSQIDSFEHDSAMEGLRDVIERRINFFGVSEPVVQTEGGRDTRRLIVEMAGVFDPHEAIELIGQTPFLEFRELKKDNGEDVEQEVSASAILQVETEDIFQSTELTGRFLERADVAFNNITQEPIINLQFNERGAEIFEELTARNIGLPLAIYLDDQPIQAPIVQGVISGGSAQITGSFSLEEAQKIVRELNAGALPVRITLISQQSVGATLGEISLQQSLRAALFGFMIVIVFMIIFYRIPGLLAAFALLMYTLILLFVFKFIGITLTLAGIAGFILSIGMAVDANILIFSRMREELREGRSFEASIEQGFSRAWPSIRDGNVTTLLVALILFWFGSSFVQGFALALSIGILLSMISAIFVTKNLLRLFIETPFEKIGLFWK